LKRNNIFQIKLRGGFMFKKMKVKSQISLGFGALIALLVVVAVFSFFGIDKTSEGFQQYRALARDTNLAGRLQANMLMVRMNVKDFLITRSDKVIQQYHEYEKKMKEFLVESKKEIQDTERAKNVSLIDSLVDNYGKAFERVTTFMKQRDKLVYGTMDPKGLEMRKNLTEIMKSAYRDNDSDAAYYAGRIQEHVLLARLYAVKFLDTNAQDSVKRFESEIGEKIDSLAETLDKSLENPERRAMYKKFLDSRKIYRKTFETVSTIINERNDLINNELDRIGPIIAKAAEDVKLSVKDDQDILGPELEKQNRKTVMLIIAISSCGLLLGIVLALFISGMVIKPLGGEPRLMAEITEKVAGGDLTHSFESNNGDASGLFASMKSMTEQLRDIVADILVNADNITGASSELSSSSETLSQGASEQAASLEEISSSMVEIDAQAKSNAEKAYELNKNVDELKKMSDTGTMEMGNMKSAMKEIEDASKSISKIIDVIDDIASQTNLLALNATIEAASAGEAGRGFAVVANEIKELASQSASAAKETAELIESSIKKVETGGEITNQTGEALRQISRICTEGVEMTAEISAGAKEQAQAIIQISQALDQVDQVTQSNTANAEETASSAEELNAQSEQLRLILARFKLNRESDHLGQYHSGGKSYSKLSDESSGRMKTMINSKSVDHEQKLQTEGMLSGSDEEFENY
ncbi:methyl-accepting chemotaxis protein, partial [Desulfobacterales bacterium HSG16]|nr:methyl-accepting chemotaxis protein [Desulfobacterales bacterium HSG16]